MSKRTHGLDEREKELVKLLMADCRSTGDIQAKLKRLFAGTIEQMLEAEMDEHLGYAEGTDAAYKEVDAKFRSVSGNSDGGCQLLLIGFLKGCDIIDDQQDRRLRFLGLSQIRLIITTACSIPFFAFLHFTLEHFYQKSTATSDKDYTMSLFITTTTHNVKWSSKKAHKPKLWAICI